MSLKAAQELVKHILNYPQSVEWSIQGLGMIRCYLGADRVVRLNIWDNRYRVPDVSSIHDHPWSFESYIVSGRLVNTKYRRSGAGIRYNSARITCGPGTTKANMEAQLSTERLILEENLAFGPGETYCQNYYDIHETHYEDGTITINTRTFERSDNSAYVYWLTGPWVSAEPRAATKDEIGSIIDHALLGLK